MTSPRTDQSPESIAYQDDSGNQYRFIKPLSGRGQPGKAGFYEDSKGQDSKGQLFLIKEDDLATCIQEGSAQFVIPFLPEEHKHAINLARIDQFSEIKKPENKSIVTIQPAIKDGVPWDRVILGVKRDPSTWRSIESQNEEKILAHIASLPNSAKADLAAAIFASALAGDESLHIGQFMAILDEENNVIGLVRVDLGARERHGILRLYKNDFKHETSKAYASSGQFGKKYMNYLLKDPDVRIKYLQLWMQSLGVDQEPGKESVDAFRAALSKIPEEKKHETIQKVYAIYAKKFGGKKEKITQKDLEEVIQKVVSTRISSMRSMAQKEVMKLIAKCDFINKLEEKLILNPSEKNYNKLAKDFLKKINKLISDPENLGKLNIYNEFLTHMYAAIEFSHLNVDNQNNLLNIIGLLQNNIKIAGILDKLKPSLIKPYWFSIDNKQEEMTSTLPLIIKNLEKNIYKHKRFSDIGNAIMHLEKISESTTSPKQKELIKSLSDTLCTRIQLKEELRSSVKLKQ